jgi:hypothetical protein
MKSRKFIDLNFGAGSLLDFWRVGVCRLIKSSDNVSSSVLIWSRPEFCQQEFKKFNKMIFMNHDRKTIA